ncbi:hypothetical protein C8J57DRAFT_1473661 [Mycena rebaudengoi]|nr:hypothetical protein C8J57DRAFT_1473661 [Mycena rebaudengoi]
MDRRRGGSSFVTLIRRLAVSATQSPYGGWNPCARALLLRRCSASSSFSGRGHMGEDARWSLRARRIFVLPRCGARKAGCVVAAARVVGLRHEQSRGGGDRTAPSRPAARLLAQAGLLSVRVCGGIAAWRSGGVRLPLNAGARCSTAHPLRFCARGRSVYGHFCFMLSYEMNTGSISASDAQPRVERRERAVSGGVSGGFEADGFVFWSWRSRSPVPSFWGCVFSGGGRLPFFRGFWAIFGARRGAASARGVSEGGASHGDCGRRACGYEPSVPWALCCGVALSRAAGVTSGVPGWECLLELAQWPSPALGLCASRPVELRPGWGYTRPRCESGCGRGLAPAPYASGTYSLRRPGCIVRTQQPGDLPLASSVLLILLPVLPR